MAVRISLSLLKALREASGKEWFDYSELSELLGGGENALYVLLEGYSLGLFNLRGESEFEIRGEGLRILDVWREAGEPSVDPWIDSRVYTMLATLRLSGSVPDEWRPILEDRGLLDARGLSTAGETIVELVPGLERNIVLTKSMARELAKAPEGPARRDEYGRFQGVMEAMGLLVGTVPLNPYYSLTRAGRLLRKAMKRTNLDAPWPSVVNRRIYEILEKAERGEPLTPEEKTYAGTLGYLKATGELDYPGRLVLAAYRSILSMRARPPMALSSVEEKLLKAVVELWREKQERKPNILVTKDRIREKYTELWGDEKGLDLGLDLLHLESLGLIEETSEDGKQVYKPTSQGEYLVGLPGVGKGSPVTAVKSITEPLGYRSPNVTWIQEGMDHDIVGVGGPTKRGEMLANASEARRIPLLTRVEAVVLQRIPDSRSVPRKTLLEEAARHVEDPWKPLNRLESRGLVETLPDDSVALTRAGRLLKTMLIAVPTGIAVPVSPVIVRVLQAVREYGTRDLATLVNKTRLTLESVRDALILAESAKLIGKGGGLTAAGRALLEAADELA